MMPRFVIRSQWEDYGNSLVVGIFRHMENGEKHICRPLEFYKREPGDLMPPTISGSIDDNMGQDFLQAALNHAWELGMRPVGFADTPQQIKAMDAHLQDMRALVFKTGKPGT
jgi:hypothetical protein